jgi:sec-independent protein translocase protein TatC
MMIGVIATLPVAVYNGIMFIQPALKKRLSKVRVYITTLASLLLAGGGAAFGFLIIIPLALRFFYKFQVDGLVAIISADEYLRFVVGVIITFVIIFQLPLIISLIDHITPLPPRKLLKLEKYIIVGSVFIGVVVPFALDPTVQLLIASPIIVLYNFSILIVMLQQVVRRRRTKKLVAAEETIKSTAPVSEGAKVVRPVAPLVSPANISQPAPIAATVTQRKRSVRMIDGVSPMRSAKPPVAVRPRAVISDIRPAPRLTPPTRAQTTLGRQVAE